MSARRTCSVGGVLCVLLAVSVVSTALVSQTMADEPLRVRRNFMGMHNLKDGGPDVLTGFHWTRNLTGETGYVFDWVFDYSLTAEFHWIEEAMKMGLIPCVRAQSGSGGTPTAAYVGQVAALICDWKLENPEYADRYVYMALWNEPGDPRDYVPMDEYADFMVAGYAAVHNAVDAAAAENSDIAGTILTITPGQNNPDSWREALEHNSNCANAFDIWGSHPYPESYPPWYNMHEGHGFVTKHKMIDGHLRDLDVFAEYGRRGFPVMITETAYGDHLGISYEGYPKTTRQMAADYNVEAFGRWWYQWPEILAVHPYILSNLSWNAFAWANGDSVDTDSDGIYEPTAPFPQYTAVRNWRLDMQQQGLLAPARVSPYRGATGTIRGTLTRSDTSEPVKYANVYTDGYEFGGPSLYDGQYFVREVPTGTYTLSVDKKGYVSASQQITVYEDQETTTNFSLVYTGRVPKGFYFVDCGAPGIECMGTCSGCNLCASYLGQTFTVPDDVGFIKYVACKPRTDDCTIEFSILEDGPNGDQVGSSITAVLDAGSGANMIGGEWAEGSEPEVDPGETYFLKIERIEHNDGACESTWIYASDSNPYSGGQAYTGTTAHGSWDLYAVVRGETEAVVTATGTISGNVEDDSEDPIQGATVTTAPGGFSATTNASGNYTISDVPVGTYSVIASKTGYSAETETGKSVTENQTTTVNFTLEEGPTTGTISGWVKNESSNGISGATVETTTGNYNTTTDGSGNYTLSNVAPGGYTVEASKSGYLTEQELGVVVIAGQSTTANITLPEEAPFSGLTNGNMEGGSFNDPNADHKTANSWHQFTIDGFSKSNVTWLGGGAHSSNYVQDFWESGYTSGIYQQASGADAGHTFEGTVWVKASDSNVTFNIGIDPTGGTDAESNNIVWGNDSNPGSTWTQISVEASANSSTITLFIKADNPATGNRNSYIDDAALTDEGTTETGTISGTVEDTSSNALEGAIVSVGDGAYSGTTDVDGDYSITDVVVGTYTVTADKAGYDTGTNNNVTVTADQTTDVDFALSVSAAPDEGDIEGVVLDEEEDPISGATVQISQTDGDYSESTTTNAYGEFDFADVPQGIYTADADAAGYCRSVVESIHVASNETTEVNFILEEATTFDGLDNGDMEDGFYNDPDGDHKSANDWSSYVVSGSPKYGGYWSPQNHSTDWAQVFYEASWTAGLYQQVTGTEQGTNYTATVWVKGHADVKFWIGIDPAGGTNPTNAEWMTNPVTPGATWTQISKQIQAGGSTITVFLKAQNPSAYNRSGWLDDAAVTTP